MSTLETSPGPGPDDPRIAELLTQVAELRDEVATVRSAWRTAERTVREYGETIRKYQTTIQANDLRSDAPKAGSWLDQLADGDEHQAARATDPTSRAQWIEWAVRNRREAARLRGGPVATGLDHGAPRDTDVDAVAWRVFLLRWHHVYGQRRLTARQLCESTELGIGSDPREGTFPFPTGGVLAGIEPVKSLGRWLTGQADRWRGDLVLRSAREAHTKVRVYWVHREVSDGPDASTRDGVS